MPTIWTEAAVADAEEIVDYIARHSPAAALNVRNRLVEAAERLGRYPHMFREGREPGTREAIVLPNYILIYRVEPTVVRVVKVLHATLRYPGS